MSKATFPNTTRRRLSSSVVCRLSSSGAAFFFPRFFFHDPSLHSDKRPPKQGPYSCCSRPMIGLRGLWLGALRGPWPVQPMKSRGLWPMTTLRGLWPGAVTPRGLWPMIALRSLWLGGAARPVARAAKPLVLALHLIVVHRRFAIDAVDAGRLWPHLVLLPSAHLALTCPSLQTDKG